MAETLKAAVAVIGIDMARPRSTLPAWIGAVRSCCGGDGHAARQKHSSPTCRLA